MGLCVYHRDGSKLTLVAVNLYRDFVPDESDEKIKSVSINPLIQARSLMFEELRR